MAPRLTKSATSCTLGKITRYRVVLGIADIILCTVYANLRLKGVQVSLSLENPSANLLGTLRIWHFFLDIVLDSEGRIRIRNESFRIQDTVMEFVNNLWGLGPGLEYSGKIDSLKSILGLLKSLKIRAQLALIQIMTRTIQWTHRC
jgi:hypothetical protein